MNRLPPLQHPLAALFQSTAQSLTTSLKEDTIRFYHGTIRNFLNFLGAQYPEVQSLEQLRRDPHILAWFNSLRCHQPPPATITYSIRVFHLRRMLEELAWTEELPAEFVLFTHRFPFRLPASMRPRARARGIRLSLTLQLSKVYGRVCERLPVHVPAWPHAPSP